MFKLREAFAVSNCNGGGGGGTGGKKSMTAKSKAPSNTKNAGATRQKTKAPSNMKNAPTKSKAPTNRG